MNEQHKEQNLKSLRTISVEYIAGFFDGEGYATIIKQNKGNKPFYYVKSTLANANKEVLESIQSIFGGSTYVYPERENCNTCYGLYLYTQAALRLFRAIIPLLIVKKPVVEIIIELADLRERWGVHSGIRYSEEQLAILEDYYIKVKNLNKK